MDLTGQIEQVIQQIVRYLVEKYQPQKIILFGSLVNGTPDENSDIDLLIIKETDKTPLERRVQVRQLVADPKRTIPLSPLVLTPNELDYRLKLGDPFYREILQQGKLLYVQN